MSIKEEMAAVILVAMRDTKCTCPRNTSSSLRRTCPIHGDPYYMAEAVAEALLAAGFR